MHSLIAALNRGEGVRPNSIHKSTDFNVSGEFAAIFNRSIAGSPAQDLLSRLRERFPTAKIAERDVPPGLEESKKAAGDDGDTTSDKVNLTSPLLKEMGLDAGLAGKIEDMLAGLFAGDTASSPGSYVQRSVTVSVTTVRYTEMRRSDTDNGILAAGELQTVLREKIDEMLADLSGALEKAFGRVGKEGKEDGAKKADGADSTEGAEGAEAAEGGKSSGKSSGVSSRDQFGGASVGLWSLELFYSSITSIPKSIGSDGNLYLHASQTETTWTSASFAASYSSFGGLTGGAMPEFLSQMLGGGNGSANGGGQAAEGSALGSIERALAESGIRFSGYRQVTEGFSFKFTQSRNLIEELMELYGERLGGGRERAATDSDAADSAGNAVAGEGAAGVEEEEAALAV